ncbi:MAG: superoxide dismutase [bacterium]|nr:superoxide dismutase [bacterium]
MKYILPELPYKTNALEPYMSEEQLTLHYAKHHQKYVDNANVNFDTFNVGGHILHSLFWGNLMTPKENNNPEGKILESIEKDFGSFEKFKEEFSKTANSVQGSGWAALCHEKTGDRLLIAQIEKHNLFLYPNSKIIMALDVWEHAYYLDYKNERTKFVEGFWNAVNWHEVNNRLEVAVGRMV